jgi:L-alanine-DL-glutamate epimerase-like enolase superfamily enzyme
MIDAIKITRGTCPLLQSIVVPGRLSASKRHFILVETHGEESIGIGLLPLWDEAEATSIYNLCLVAAPAVLGSDHCDTDESYQVFARALGRTSDNELLLAYSRAVLDISLWDLKARIRDLPMWKLLGQSLSKVPGYASGCWFNTSPSQVAKEALLYKDAGFSAIKMRVGLQDVAYDLARIDAVRNVFDGRLMLEAATTWHIDEAMGVASELMSYDPFWIEDPFPFSDTQNLQRLKSTGLPLAGGEWAVGNEDVERIIDTHQYDYLILDLFRIGGVTPWLTACATAVSSGYLISSHVNSELSVQLLCGLRGSLYAEVIDLGERFFSNKLQVEHGFVVPPEASGWGLQIDFDYLDRFAIDSAGFGENPDRRRRVRD